MGGGKWGWTEGQGQEIAGEMSSKACLPLHTRLQTYMLSCRCNLLFKHSIACLPTRFANSACFAMLMSPVCQYADIA